MSHPTWVRGLKLQVSSTKRGRGKSHPTWVRGLKLDKVKLDDNNNSRTLRGCVD